MKKKLLTIAIILVIFGMVVIPVAALPTKSPLPPSNPWNIVWGLFQDLQNQINTLTANVAALQAKDTDLQTQINNIPGPVHFGDWSLDNTYTVNQKYSAATDGFVVGEVLYTGTQPEATVTVYYQSLGPYIGGPTFSNTFPKNYKQSFNVPIRAGVPWAVGVYPNPADEPLAWTTNIKWLPLTSS